jgi:hypothetical protein
VDTEAVEIVVRVDTEAVEIVVRADTEAVEIVMRADTEAVEIVARADTKVVEIVVRADTEVVEIVEKADTATSPFRMIGDKKDQAGVIHLKKVETGDVENNAMQESPVSDLKGEATSLKALLNVEKINHRILVSQKAKRAIKETGVQRNGMISPLTNSAA